MIQGFFSVFKCFSNHLIYIKRKEILSSWQLKDRATQETLTLKLYLNTFVNEWTNSHKLCEKCPNTEFFLVSIFSYSVRIRENTDQKKLRIWTLFTQWQNIKIWHRINLHLLNKFSNGIWISMLRYILRYNRHNTHHHMNIYPSPYFQDFSWKR